MTAAELEQPCTESEVPNGAPWRPADHLSHLAFIERQFQKMIRRAIDGEGDPVGFNRVGSTSREDIIAWVHRQNQGYAEAHAGDSLEETLADLTAVRGETLALIDQLTDEQLAQRVPGAPWNDGTVGGILFTNAPHAVMHTAWVGKARHQPE